jgi:hypothetical protein
MPSVIWTSRSSAGAAMIVGFDFYGLTVEVSCAAPELVEEVRRDFAYFQVPTDGAQVQVEMRLSAPPYSELPAIPASFLTPRNICFHNGRLSYIDYFGRGLVVFDRQIRQCIVYGTDRELLREIVYLFLLSTVGQHLDQRRLHRVHALGVSYRGRGILLLLPSGGGKSTMALQLLKHPGVSLLGEDTPLIDHHGRILPFPLRPGVRHGQQTGIPPQFLRTVQRMEFDPKTLIDIEFFRDRIGQAVEPGAILVGERNLGDVSEITPLARRRALRALLKYAVVGLGVYQGMEFLLERGLGEMLGKGGVVASRLYNSLRLLSRAPSYRFVLGRDTTRNFETLLDFCNDTAQTAGTVESEHAGVL